MNITVIITTYNNKKRLKVTLNHFDKATKNEKIVWEIIVVDNNSEDGTREVVKSYEPCLPIKYLFEPKQGKTRAQNTGLDAAQGELIVFTDDDVKPSNNWLNAYWEAYRSRPEGYYFGGPVESEYEGAPPDEDLLRITMPSVSGLDFGSQPHKLADGQAFIGPNWACPERYIQDVGKFNEELGPNPSNDNVDAGDETEMMARLESRGLSGWYVPEAKVKHYVPKSKCTLDHVVSRLVGDTGDDLHLGSSSLSTVFGVPVGMYKAAVEHLLSWRARKTMGMKWKAEYLGWKIWENRIKNIDQKNGERQ
jgi:glycosyltransferase involved in cell wall biosynthesis